MNTYQIDRVIRQHVRRFDDVFACDRLLTKPRLMVCNTDPSDMPVEHWIAIYVDDDGRYGEYFDPIGRASTRVFEHYMNEHCCEWIYSSKQLKGIASRFCGYYCACFCIVRSGDIDMSFCTLSYWRYWTERCTCA